MIFSIIFALPADASVTLVPKPADAPDICPGSDSIQHAMAEAEWVLNNSCDQVRQEIYARVAKENNWIDAHNQGTYANRTATDDESLIALTRTTGRVMFPGTYENEAFTDKLNLNLVPKDDTQCEVYGCSQSQVMSKWDYSTNFCNLQVLVGGTNRTGDDDYKYIYHDLETDSREIYFASPHNGTLTGFMGAPVPDAEVQPDLCISYPTEPIAQCDSEITGNCNCGTVYCNEFEHKCSTNEDGEQRCEGEPDYARLAHKALSDPKKYGDWATWWEAQNTPAPCTGFWC